MNTYRKKLWHKFYTFVLALSMLVVPFSLDAAAINEITPYGLQRAITVVRTGDQYLTEEIRNWSKHNRVVYNVKMTYQYNDNTGEIVGASVPTVVSTLAQEYGNIDPVITYESRTYKISSDKKSVTFSFRIKIEDRVAEYVGGGYVYDTVYRYHYSDSFTIYAD